MKLYIEKITEANIYNTFYLASKSICYCLVLSFITSRIYSITRHSEKDVHRNLRKGKFEKLTEREKSRTKKQLKQFFVKKLTSENSTHRKICFELLEFLNQVSKN